MSAYKAYGASVLLLLATTSGVWAVPKFVNFDVPGAYSTRPSAINDTNEIVGYYGEGSQSHGFIRAADGTITSFDPKGSVSTVLTGVNNNGDSTGSFEDSSGLVYGFIRSANGTVVKFDASHMRDTSPLSINDIGDIAGIFTDKQGSALGFIRNNSGQVTGFGVTGAEVTFAWAINNARDVTGYASFSPPDTLGYIRTADGTATTFSVQGAYNTQGLAINQRGVIAGDAIMQGPDRVGFLRMPNGRITTFAPPKGETIFVTGLSEKNWVVGNYNINAPSGFVRRPDGNFMVLNDPDIGGANDQGTYPVAINSNFYVTGYYIDSNNTDHGFIYRVPR